MMISSNSNCVTSCRLAPVTTRDNGTPRPSTSRWRLVSPVGRVSTSRLLDHSAINALPSPGDAFHFIVFCKARTPQSNENPLPDPAKKMRVDSTGAAKSLFRQRLPLATSSQHKKNGFKYLPCWHWFSTTPRFSLISFCRIPFWERNQWFNFFPKLIRYFPRLNFCHRAPECKVIIGGTIAEV